jgi:thioester reductase-like protein
VGQVSGDSKTGVWNTTEMISLMICVGGGELGVLPEDGQRIDWIPVDYAAICIVDIVIDISTPTAAHSERVHHILNPHVISWSQLLEYLKSSGLRFKVVPNKEWLTQLFDSPSNSAHMLANFYKKVFDNGGKFELAKFTVEKTCRRTAALERCPFINQKLVQLYLNYWLELAFLTHGYTSGVNI